MPVTVPGVFALICGVFAIVWGTIGFARNEWMVRFAHRMMRRAWGRTVAQIVTPNAVRLSCAGVVVFGVGIAASVFVVPDFYAVHS